MKSTRDSYFLKPFCSEILFLGGLPSDPRTWGREEVTQFLQYCEKEFDLEKIDMDRFQMNGRLKKYLKSYQ